MERASHPTEKESEEIFHLENIQIEKVGDPARANDDKGAHEHEGGSANEGHQAGATFNAPLLTMPPSGIRLPPIGVLFWWRSTAFSTPRAMNAPR